jgi:hypothetical protein
MDYLKLRLLPVRKCHAFERELDDAAAKNGLAFHAYRSASVPG